VNWKELLNPTRPRPSTVPTEHREEFERDFDRSIFSTPVKRLQDKAQVFPLEPHDAVRTRLTHSLEVSTVSRGIATAVSKRLMQEKEVGTTMDRQIEAIAATAGLIHDLGNPPFGHAGEDAIREWFKTHGRENLRQELGNDVQRLEDLLKFEGNAQTLRIVSKLQILSDFNGLNLTYGTLSACCKYIARSDEADTNHGNHARAKPGYFASENSLISQIRNLTGTGEARNPITFLVEAADDIVYSVADIEDGIKKGVISWHDILSILKSDENSETKRVVDLVLERKDLILKAGGSIVPTDLADDVHGSAFRTAAISHMVRAVVETFFRNYDEIMAGKYLGELVSEGEIKSFVKLLKRIGRAKIYCTPSTLKLELLGRRLIKDLMDIFWEGAQKLAPNGSLETKTFSGRAGALLSRNYRDAFCHAVEMDPANLPYHRYQLVTDYVCGMTDTFAKRLHAELTNG
jgi:dGTPase